MADRKKIMAVAREVIAGDWGSGEKRKEALIKAGYDYDVVQREVNRLLSCRELIIQNIRDWATKIADTHKYKYIYWTESYGHECAICHPHNGKNKGWQCIGWTIACWHHGGLPIPCNCGVIDNGTGEKILKAKTDSEALKIAQKALKLKDIEVIRNNGKTIPKSKVQPGDIALMFVDGNVFQHMYLIMSDKYISDSTTAGGFKKDISAKRNFGGRYVSGMKVVIRYTGNGFAKPEKKTVDELAHEVIDGLWGSGESRKKALTECGYNYNAVQKRVNEILSESTYTGTLPTTKLVKSNAEVIADTIKWGKWIAGDNRFHYGYGTHAYHNGCYFCGTQKMKMSHGILDPEFTYCCNPFVGACWAHGGCVPEALKLCQNYSSWGFVKSEGYEKSSLFDKLGKPAISKLKPGDVLCGDSHVALYIGDGKVVQAGHVDDNVRNSKKWNSSISIGTWNGWKRAYRFNSSVNTTCIIRHGEIGKRVALWQAFLDWYYNGKVGKADGYYGDNTLKWTKKFQEEYFGKKEADGLIGDKTLAKAKTAKKK